MVGDRRWWCEFKPQDAVHGSKKGGKCRKRNCLKFLRTPDNANISHVRIGPFLGGYISYCAPSELMLADRRSVGVGGVVLQLVPVRTDPNPVFRFRETARPVA
jgi:hypothetical protein